MLAPLLSARDERDSAEGSIDPLGFYSIADRLASKMIPGVRERQRRARFLTHMAVSLEVCSSFPEGAVARDGVSEPWQVFEWYVVEGLVRSTKAAEKLRGLPGHDKARAAVEDGAPLSAPRYLKSPRIFGFHGIYRALARDIGLERAGCLDETGYLLLRAWGEERGVPGFLGSAGEGAGLKRMLRDAVKDGLEKGATSRGPGWSGWGFFSEHLGIRDFTPKERKVVLDALLRREAGFRGEVFTFLTGSSGKSLWEEENSKPRPSEARLHDALRESASAALAEHLSMIRSYERFCRLLDDAFYECLELLSTGRRLRPAELSQGEAVSRAASDCPSSFRKALESLAANTALGVEFSDRFAVFGEKHSPSDWVRMLVSHHAKVQRGKLPAGKASWMERFDDGSYISRAAYRRDRGAYGDDSYVQAYRTNSLWEFATDLGLIG